MKKQTMQEERECICLDEHEHLANLVNNDRFSFEQKRKRLIEENIANQHYDITLNNLRSTQKKIDNILSGAGSQHNRFAMMQALFWDYIVSVWIPALNDCKRELAHIDLSVQQVMKPQLSLVAKAVTESDYRSTPAKCN